MLQDQPDMKVVGEAADGRSAVMQVEKLRPNVVIMDVTMPGLNGVECSGPDSLDSWLTNHTRALSSDCSSDLGSGVRAA